MKNFVTVCFMIAFLSFGIQAQEGQLITNELQGNEAEAALMILDKESNWPICRLSDQVSINSELLPEDRIGDVDTTSIEDVKLCDEEDIWNAVEEEMLVGMAAPSVSVMNGLVIPIAAMSGFSGCIFGLARPSDGRFDNNNMREASMTGGVLGIIGGLVFQLAKSNGKSLPFPVRIGGGLGFVLLGSATGLIFEKVCRHLAD